MLEVIVGILAITLLIVVLVTIRNAISLLFEVSLGLEEVSLLLVSLGMWVGFLYLVGKGILALWSVSL